MPTSKAPHPPGIVIGTKKTDIQYTERTSVRVVVRAPDNRVVILRATKDDYYKLPGGGVELGEDHLGAAEREMAEETGCTVDLQGPCVATAEEYRGHLHQISYCYLARLIDDSGKPALTEEEVEDGLQHEWVSVDEALRKMRGAKPTTEFGLSVKERDVFLLTQATKSWRLYDDTEEMF